MPIYHCYCPWYCYFRCSFRFKVHLLNDIPSQSLRLTWCHITCITYLASIVATTGPTLESHYMEQHLPFCVAIIAQHLDPHICILGWHGCGSHLFVELPPQRAKVVQ